MRHVTVIVGECSESSSVIAVLPEDASDEQINEAIEKSFENWTMPPSETIKDFDDGTTYSLVREDRVVRIEYRCGNDTWQDEGDDVFLIFKVPTYE